MSEQGTGCLHSRTRPLYSGTACIGRQCRLCGARMFEVSAAMAELADALAVLGLAPETAEAQVRALVEAAEDMADEQAIFASQLPPIYAARLKAVRMALVPFAGLLKEEA